MQADQLKQRINRIEQFAGEAKRAVQADSVPGELRQCVNDLHNQASQMQQEIVDQEQVGPDGIRQRIMRLEETGDRAMEACRSAGGSVDQQTQQSVKRAHDEISDLKHQIQMH